MSLKPKRIDYEAVWTHFKNGTEKILTLSGLDKISGMQLFQYVLIVFVCTRSVIT